MSAFSVDAALEGFRFTREHPRAVLVWTSLSFVVGLVGGAVLIATGAQQAIAALPRIDPADSSWTTAYAAALPDILPGATAHAVLSFVFFAVLSCSAFRAFLKDEGRVSLRFGGQELRMIGLMITLALIGLGVSLVMDGLTGFLTLVLGGPKSGPGALAFALGEVVKLCLQAVIMVRLALGSPMIVGEGRWSLRESWRRTHGRFWPMLGALVIAAMLYLLVAFLVGQLFFRLGELVRIGLGRGAAAPTGLAQLIDPASLVLQIGVAFALALGVPILAGPLAAAYRRFDSPKPSETADVRQTRP